MKDFVEYIARQLVDEPAEVALSLEERGEKLLIRLRVAQPDIGKVIGKKGRTAFALRTLVAAVGKKQGKKVLLEVCE